MTDSSLKAIGKKIRKARMTSGLTQEDVSKKVALSTTYYAQIERGLRNPSATVLIKIAKVLGIKPSDILEN